ncbi:MAG: diaminopimelate decarboxylase [Geminicoccaceae bacterium]
MDDGVGARKARATEAAVTQGLLGGERLLAGFVDVTGVRETVGELRRSFPGHFTHAFAAKAACLEGILRLLRSEGMACEVASRGELGQALGAGFAAARIVFDSPAKTWGEIRLALERGMTLNIDSFQELERVDAVLGELGGSPSVIGIRVNPQVGIGTIAAMSTATRTSKFGIALDDPGNRARILSAFRERPWLTCVHTHIGSQGCPLELIAGGVAKAVALAEEINARAGRRQVTTIDIGGGLPVNFEGDEVSPTFADYAAILREAAPALFSGEFQVITEFGRSLLAKNGFIVARVEYTKVTGGHHIAITHAGAQVATRTVFMPELWPIRVSALDPDGRSKAGPKLAQDVAGPCCFAGDIVAGRRDLPLLEPGDWVLLHDTGAYYFSTPFVYNSLPRIAVHGFWIDGGQVRFELLRREECLEEVVAATSLAEGAHAASGTAV